MSHTKEPWSEDQIDSLLHGCLNNNFTPVTQANRQRMLAAVNGCAGLNPATFKECVEALKLVQENAVDWVQFPEIVEKVEQALEHAHATGGQP